MSDRIESLENTVNYALAEISTLIAQQKALTDIVLVGFEKTLNADDAKNLHAKFCDTLEVNLKRGLDALGSVVDDVHLIARHSMAHADYLRYLRTLDT